MPQTACLVHITRFLYYLKTPSMTWHDSKLLYLKEAEAGRSFWFKDATANRELSVHARAEAGEWGMQPGL